MKVMKKNTEEAIRRRRVYDYILTVDSIFMYTWKYGHMRQMTSNPVESCVSVLSRDPFQNGVIRAFMNRYRMVLKWMLLRMKRCYHRGV